MVLKVESSQFSFDVNLIELEGVLNFAKSVMDSYIGDFILNQLVLFIIIIFIALWFSMKKVIKESLL